MKAVKMPTKLLLLLFVFAWNGSPADEIEILTGVTSSTGEEVCKAWGFSKRAVEIKGKTSSGTGSATVNIGVKSSRSPASYKGITICSKTLALSTTDVTDYCLIDTPWSLVCADVTSISGTGASVDVTLQYSIE